jgi:hypothetical protein
MGGVEKIRRMSPGELSAKTTQGVTDLNNHPQQARLARMILHFNR